MLRWLTAGESHGPALVATIEGLPAGVEVTTADVVISTLPPRAADPLADELAELLARHAAEPSRQTATGLSGVLWG